jgi:hypothetical protein
MHAGIEEEFESIDMTLEEIKSDPCLMFFIRDVVVAHFVVV